MKYEKCKIEYTVLGEDKYQVKLSSVYDTNCSEQEYQVVNGQVMKYLLENEKELAAHERTIRNHFVSCLYNDIIGSDRTNAAFIEETKYSFVLEEEREQKIKIRGLIKPIIDRLTNLQRNRLYMCFGYGLSINEIADAEGVTAPAVCASCMRAIDRLSKFEDELLNVGGYEWLDLLKSPNFKVYFKFFSKTH